MERSLKCAQGGGGERSGRGGRGAECATRAKPCRTSLLVLAGWSVVLCHFATWGTFFTHSMASLRA